MALRRRAAKTLRSSFSTALALCLTLSPFPQAAAAVRAAPKIRVIAPAASAVGAAGLGVSLPELSLNSTLSSLSFSGLGTGLKTPSLALPTALQASLAALPSARTAEAPRAEERATDADRLRSISKAKDPKPLWTGSRPKNAAAPSLPVFAAPSAAGAFGGLLAKGEDSSPEPRENGVDAGYAADTEADVLIRRRTPWLWVRDAILYARITASSLYWYTFPRLSQRWDQLENAIAKNPGVRHAVRDFPGFFIAHRVLGSTGNYAPMGFRPATNRIVVSDAWHIFTTYFSHDKPARKAFSHLIHRAQKFNPNRGSTQFRKILFHALREASVLSREELPGYFDSLVTNAKAAMLEEYQAAEQAQILAQFDQIVRETVLERSGGYPAGKRIIGALLLGSFANGSAGPLSDLDVQLISEDGLAAFVPGFFRVVKQKWIAAGLQKDHPIGNFQYALAPSKKLITRIHRESYMVFSPY
ncbi:MAG: hypothetical protein V3S11_02040, partial [Elusimicrobiota bacterium]